MNSNHVLIEYKLSFEGFQLGKRLSLIPSDFVRKLLKLDSRFEVTPAGTSYFVRKPLNRTQNPQASESFAKDFLEKVATCTTDPVTVRFLDPVRCSFIFVESEGEFSIETYSYRRVETSAGTIWEVA